VLSNQDMLIYEREQNYSYGAVKYRITDIKGADVC